MAYQQALNETEQWVASKAVSVCATTASVAVMKSSGASDNSPRNARDIDLGENQNQNNEAESNAAAILEDNMSLNITVQGPSDTTVQGGGRAGRDDVVDGQGSSQGKGLLDRFKLLGTKMFTGAASNPSVRTEAGEERCKLKWAHESMLESDTMCLWSSPGEVVPFISSSNRSALPPFESVQYHFQEGVLAVAASCVAQEYESISALTGDGQGEGRMTFPAQLVNFMAGTDSQESQGESAPGVIYFGIDCRDERERTLGLFPRVHHAVSCCAIEINIFYCSAR